MIRPSTIADDIGKGVVAGIAGTAAMTASSMVERRLRDRGPSTAPAQAVEQVLEIKPVSDDAEARLGNLTHWGYGVAWGVARGALAASGLREPWVTLAHFGGVWGAEITMLPRLGLSSPIWKWGGEAIGIDAWHHFVYAAATGLAYDLLEHW